MIKFEVRGHPRPLKRHRTVVKNGKIRQYDPSAKEKRNFLMYVHQFAPNSPITAPISMELTFGMARPKSHYRQGKFAGILKDNAPLYHTGRPDIDNLIKYIADALNCVFYRDDSQISTINAIKIYDEIPSTTVIISELREANK